MKSRSCLCLNFPIVMAIPKACFIYITSNFDHHDVFILKLNFEVVLHIDGVPTPFSK